MTRFSWDATKWLAGFTAACLLSAFWATGARAADLLSVYRLAADSSPTIARADALLQADKASRPLARSALMPKLNAGASVGRNHVNMTGFGAGKVDETYTGKTYSVELTQPIFNGQAYVALRAADAQVRAGEAALLAARQDIIVRVCRAYFGLLDSAAAARVAQSEKNLVASLLKRSQAFLKEGAGDIISVHEATARMDAADASLIRAQSQVEINRERLERLTHQAVGPIEDLGPLQAELPRPNRMQPWVETALDNQPLLTRAKENLQIARDDVEIARRARWPSLDLASGYAYNKGEFLPTIQRHDFQLGLMLSVPIYEGGEIGARVGQAEARSLAAEHEIRDLQDQVRLDTRDAFLTLRDSVAQVQAAEQAMASSKVAMEATQKGFEIGTRTMIDALNAVQDFVTAQHRYDLARYQHVLARVRLKAAAGVLDEKDVAALNGLLCASASDGPGRTPPEAESGALPEEPPGNNAQGQTARGQTE